MLTSHAQVAMIEEVPARVADRDLKTKCIGAAINHVEQSANVNGVGDCVVVDTLNPHVMHV